MTTSAPWSPPAPAAIRGIAAGLVIGVACLLWGSGVYAGLRLLWRYEASPGAAAEPPLEWPPGSHLERIPGRPTLVMLAHPRCACTRASLAELNRVVARVEHAFTVYVLFAKPPGAPEGWEDTGTWARAHEIPGATVLRDDAGEEARRFRAHTSGQTVVYDGAGRLLFSGGITPARGREGDNAGRRRLLSLLGAGTADRRESAVFGCALTDPPEGTGSRNPVIP